MLYIELYLYDYLKKKKTGAEVEIELWGICEGRDFYICHLRQMGERKPLYQAHMQYLGNYRGLEGTDKKKITLIYQKQEELYSQKATVYIAKETEQIEHFLIKEKSKSKPETGHEPEGARVSVKINENQNWRFSKIIAFAFLIFLIVNMIETLSSYENMKEVIEVLKLLSK